MKKIGKINKKKLFFVVFLFIVIIFLIFKASLGLRAYFSSFKKLEPVIKNQEEIKKDKIINIVIDPAKGGLVEGLSTPDGSLKEKDINLDIARIIKSHLEKHDDIDVCLTREYDEALDMDKRLECLKKNRADLLVSIRLNAQGKPYDAQGMDTYYSDLSASKNIRKPSRDDKADRGNDDIISKGEVEKKERNTEEINKEYKKQEERKILSKRLAESIQSTTLSFIDFKDRGIKNKNFDILLYTEVPSVIVQCGFISNKDDGEKLQNEKTRQDIAKGISDGILNYIDSYRNEIIKDRVNYR